MSWFDRLKGGESKARAETIESPGKNGEVAPPWVEYPGIGPGEFFWREAGEPWKTQIWEPYYNGLSEGAQAEYLARWNVPRDWQEGYFDKEWREFWDHVDDPE